LAFQSIETTTKLGRRNKEHRRSIKRQSLEEFIVTDFALWNIKFAMPCCTPLCRSVKLVICVCLFALLLCLRFHGKNQN